MDFVNNIIIALLSGFFSSVIFYLLLTRLRPIIEISPFIAKVEHSGKTYYDFKIINKSNRPLIDVRAHISLAERINAEGGPVYQTKLIKLFRDHYFELGCFNLKDNEADFDVVNQNHTTQLSRFL